MLPAGQTNPFFDPPCRKNIVYNAGNSNFFLYWGKRAIANESEHVQWQLYICQMFWNGKMAIFPTGGENSNSCEISHFPVSKQTVKVQFSLDVLGNSIFRIKCGEAYFNKNLLLALPRKNVNVIKTIFPQVIFDVKFPALLKSAVKNRGSHLRKGSYLHLILKIDLKVKIYGTVKCPPRSWSTFVRTIFS